MTSGPGTSSLPSRVNGACLGVALGESERALRAGREALDRMAAAVLLSLEHVDECARWLPEPTPAIGDDAAPLSRARKQFLREQKTLLGRVARLLESHAGSRVRALLVHPEKAGLVVICAWCERVRTAEEVWLPIGHFLPRSGPFEVTHGMCPPCAADFQGDAGDEAPSARRRRVSS